MRLSGRVIGYIDDHPLQTAPAICEIYHKASAGWQLSRSPPPSVVDDPFLCRAAAFET
jgi:hypothetical protein